MKLLIAEDEQAIARPLGLKLQRENFDVEIVGSGSEVIKSLKKSIPDLLLLDIIMPDMNGFEVLEKVKELQIEVPIIMVSNLSQKGDIEKAKKLGAIDYMQKSQISLSQLIKRINEFAAQKDEST